MSDTSRGLIVPMRKMMIISNSSRFSNVRQKFFYKISFIRLLRIKFTFNDLTYMDYRRRAVSS